MLTRTDAGGLQGPEALAPLARRFPQLYVAPADGAQDVHRLACVRGVVPEGASLSHFEGSDRDELRAVETPAGVVEVLFLEKRADFECFLRIVGHRSQPVEISPTIGAITYRGLPDWSAVAAARAAYLEGGRDDWPAEFARLARLPGTFRAELVVISEGPYSNIDASETPYDAQEWIGLSREIRLHHECAHVVCRRLMPDDILPVWDEVTADVVGLIGATGAYDSSLAARFLGVTADGYAGGRLYEYLDEGQRAVIDATSAEVYAALARIELLADEAACAHPFDFLLDLKRNPLLAY